MVRATLHLKIRPGLEADFERAWRDVARAVQRAPGNLRQALLRDPADAGAFVITSDWADEASFRCFDRSPEQDALTATIRALRESALMGVHELVAHVESEESAWHG